MLNKDRHHCNIHMKLQGVHKVRVHFKKIKSLFLFVIEIICKND